MTDATPSQARLRIYLAGPEVFLPNALEAGRRKVELCAEAGFEGVFPLDASLDLAGLDKLEQARRISLANEALMRSCDLLIANMTPFRGVSMDAGTAFEIGFMRALGRPVLGYSNVTPDLHQRSVAFRARGIPPGDSDRPDTEIENFGLAENLMLAIAIVETGSNVVTHSVTPGKEMTDLTAFTFCLDDARHLIPSDS
ncbi:MAG: nucleoside 2-deoxyribosyltransferase [Hyphomicrobiaceae bacterium]